MYVMLSIGCAGKSEKETVDKEIIAYLKMPVQEIIDRTNTNIDESGSLVIFQPDIFFPCISMNPFVVICKSADTTYTPRYISFYKDYEDNYLKMLKLNSDMNFQEIMEVMGTVPIEESLERGSGKRYMISIKDGELEYNFCSTHQDGRGFELYIDLAGE